jgi:AcrR family transcriptional regulator
LVDIAARLLAEEGPESLSTRRIAAEAGSSTMAVYTHFGGMSGLVREIVYEGFARLNTAFTAVAETDDPVADLATFGRAYRFTAQTNPHLYAVMFGGESLAGFELSEDDRQHGRYTLTSVVECTTRCMASKRFRADDEFVVAHHMWLAMHGLVALELGQYLVPPYEANRLFETQLVALMTGAGDGFDAAASSVERSAERFETEVAAPLRRTARTAKTPGRRPPTPPVKQEA